MKNIAKSLMVTAAMALAGTVSANVLADLNPYAGVEYQHNWVKGVNRYSISGQTIDLSKTAPKALPGFNLYVGTKLNENFGLELGGDTSLSKKRTVAADATTMNPAPGVANHKTVVSERRLGLHLDAVGFVPVADCFEMFGTLGLGWAKVKLNGLLQDQNNQEVVNSKYDRVARGLVFRAGIGANYMITEMIGLRAKLGFENTHRLKTKENGAKQKLVRNTTSLAAGVFVRF